MTTTNAPATDLQAEGFEADPRTRNAYALVNAAARLGIDRPRNVAEAAQTLEQVVRRMANPPAPQPLEVSDLLADDWQDRVVAAGAAAAGATHMASVMAAARAQAHAALTKAVVAAVPTVADQLEAWYLRHLDQLSGAGVRDGSLSVHQLEANDQLHANFSAALDHLLRTDPAAAGSWDVHVPWFATHSWTTEQYRALVESTGPALRFTGNRIAHAQRLGAQPRLARSYAQAEQEAHAAVAEYRSSEGMPATFNGRGGW